jgi:hypothetical protein
VLRVDKMFRPTLRAIMPLFPPGWREIARS